MSPGPAAAQERGSFESSADDLSVMMDRYAGGVTDLRDFVDACVDSPPTDWDDGAALLLASVMKAGLGPDAAMSLRRRLSKPAGRTPVDCESALSVFRQQLQPVESWSAYHAGMLEAAGIPVVNPETAEDGRLAGIRSALAEFTERQSKMLACMALIEPRYFPFAYTDWNSVVDDIAHAMGDAGIDEAQVAASVDPVRAGTLLAKTSETPEGCAADRGWMDWYANFGWYAIKSRVGGVLAGRE
ncbi:MAG TPA: hypothetical protein GX405_18850 [Rhizobiales bacterium]|nr:hypothetical protein [Hyphomicrobiales bacterium]